MSSVVGAAHLKASDFTSAFQTPFGKRLSEIYDPIQKASTAGTLTYAQANDALTTFNQEWTSFDQAAQQFKDKGGDWAKVVTQAYDPNKDFMKTVSNVRNDLTNWTAGLKPADTGTDGATKDATTPPTMQTILTSLGLTPEGAASGAAAQQKKKAASATKTILTSGLGLPELAAANRQTKTLLGY